MPKLPLWAKLETVGVTERGNCGVRLTIRWWAVPYILLARLWLELTGRWEPPADECDGLEIVETKIG